MTRLAALLVAVACLGSYAAQALAQATCPGLSASPAALGYRMPAEWEPQNRTWLGWPSRPDNWRNDAKDAQIAIVNVAHAIARFQPVTVVANESDVEHAQAQLAVGADGLKYPIDVVAIPNDDAWLRDTGPSFVVRPSCSAAGGSLAGIDWDFNGWGGGITPVDNDNAMAGEILKLAGATRFACPLVLEGGAIHVDGEGTLLTSADTLLSPLRNPHMTAEQVEACLKETLGKVIMLPENCSLHADLTTHVDNLATFARPGVVLLAWTDDTLDPQYPRSLAALQFLLNQTDARDRPLQVVKLPLPPPLNETLAEFAGRDIFWGAQHGYTFHDLEGQSPLEARGPGSRKAASYNNFVLVNGGLIMPALGLPEADERAATVLREQFPGREVVQVQTRDLVLGGGNIHCLTQQQPLVPSDGC